MWNEQKGLCFGFIPMKLNGDWKVSLERKDPREPYSKDNCILICREFNVTDTTIHMRNGHKSGVAWTEEKLIRWIEESV